MSEEFSTPSADVSTADSSPVDATASFDPGTSGDSASPEPIAESSSDVFADQDYNEVFGLRDEEPDEPAPDVPPVTDPPANRQSEKVTTETEKDMPDAETPKADPDPDTSTEKPAFEPNEKLNWEDEGAPKQFRDEFKALKQAYTDLANSSVEMTYLADPAGFRKWMEETSPTSFQEVGTQIATESANANPQAWIEYFIANQPDMVAEMLTGKPGLTRERLQAELEIMLDDDDPEVKDALERQKALAQPEAAPAQETPEQKEIREFREERQRQQYAAMTSEVFGPIENAIDSLVSEAGLDIDLNAIKEKDFASLDDDMKFKVAVNQFIPYWIDQRAQQDPKLLSLQNRVEEALKKGDKATALNLQHHMKIAATNFASEALAILTGKRAESRKALTQSPVKEKPPVQVRSTAAAGIAASAVANGKGDIDWGVTENDLFGR